MIKIILAGIFCFSFVLFIYVRFPQSEKLITPNLSTKSENSEPQITVPTLSIEQIFSKDHSFKERYPKDKLITIVATGDIIPARYINFQTISRRNFKWPYENTYQFLQNTDLTFANLETPLIKDCPVITSGMIFCGDEKNIEGLVYGGIDIVNLANNHTGNYGQKGVDDTVQLLNQNGILSTGVNGAIYREIKDIKFAFLGFNDIEKVPYVSSAKDEIITEEIREAKITAAVVIVTFHWGTEYTDLPNQRQQGLAHLAIDAGADLVLGNHPHWIQPMEIYKDKTIIYAQGNFIFDQFWSNKTLEGVLAKYYFYGNRLIDVEFLPIQINNFGQPNFADQKTADRILTELKFNSEKLMKVL